MCSVFECLLCIGVEDEKKTHHKPLKTKSYNLSEAICVGTTLLSLLQQIHIRIKSISSSKPHYAVLRDLGLGREHVASTHYAVLRYLGLGRGHVASDHYAVLRDLGLGREHVASAH